MNTTPVTSLGSPSTSSAPARIAVFLSKGQNFVDVLRGVRNAYPGASIDAVIPRGYPLSKEERALADRIVETERAHYGPRDVGALLRLVRELRAPHYDLFVVMFDSPKLRLLARLSNARTCTFYRLDHRTIPIYPSLPGVLADVIWRNVWGRAAYGVLWLVVRLLPVNKA